MAALTRGPLEQRLWLAEASGEEASRWGDVTSRRAAAEPPRPRTPPEALNGARNAGVLAECNREFSDES